MIILNGKYNSAKVVTDVIEEDAVSQIITFCNQPVCKDSSIRIMPDVHAGAGCTIGTTMTITDKVIPNLVGVDIGCGMETIRLKEKHIELQKLDKRSRQRPRTQKAPQHPQARAHKRLRRSGALSSISVQLRLSD